jgi:hypothetical protein
LLGELDLSQADRQKLFHDNAVRILNLRQPQAARVHPRGHSGLSVVGAGDGGKDIYQLSARR